MTPQETLDAVRALSENATLRPATKHLRLARGTEPKRERVIIAYQELHPPVINGGTPHYKPRKPKPVREVVSRPALEKQWMAEKAARAHSVRPLSDEEFAQRCRQQGIASDAA